MSTSVEHPPPRPKPGYVPVERRWLGLDRRSLPAALVVAVVGILFGGILPLINQAIDTDDPIVAGDVLDLGQGITMIPPVGWELESGLRVSDEGGISAAVPPAILSSGGVRITVQTIATPSGPTAILDDFEKISGETDALPDFTVTGGRSAFVSDRGVAGIIENYSGLDAEGLIAVFAFDAKDVALAVQVDAPRGQLAAARPEVRQMLRTLTRVEVSR